MIIYMSKFRNQLSLFSLLIIKCFIVINSLNEVKRLKIGLQNKQIIFYENQTIYEIKTNFLYLTIKINNFENINRSQIADKIISDSPSVGRCSYTSNICQSKTNYIIKIFLFI